MYLLQHLKETIEVSRDEVECPIIGCRHRVERQKGKFLREPKFYCTEHKIYISPSTFEYADEQENLLWQHPENRQYLEEIKDAKRESRMARERSEDALTWNVFRYLHKNQLLSLALERFIGEFLEDPEIIYWSYSSVEKGVSSLLREARNTFGETSGTEPDLIINSKNHLIFIEAKFTSSNQTKPRTEGYLKKYAESQDGWYQAVFQKDIHTVCIEMQKYELMRNYLLGTWLANKHGKKFTLLSLNTVNFGRDEEDMRFRDCLIENDQYHYIYSVWEELRGVIINHLPDSLDKEILLDYLRNKSAGYRNGKVVGAFV
jgi:hypothetical protein